MPEIDLRSIKNNYRIIGNSEELNRAIDIAVRVAPTDLSILIQGESGTGKEAIPRIIHDKSLRKSKKYLAINCGSIPEGTIDSELFGHVKGAFTGADRDREGYFGEANDGTLFLDEVGELPLQTQARLLRVLETGEYLRVGSSEVKKTNVRIVAATNVNLDRAISEGKFREDLYYRLNTISLNIPPLRERGDDIILLFTYFARDIAMKYKVAPISLTEDAKQLLKMFKWPGNIRQLKNLAEQITFISTDRVINAETLKQFGITDDSATGRGLVIAKPQQQSDYVYENERDMIFQVLSRLSNEVKDLKQMINQNKENSVIQPTVIQNPSIMQAPTIPTQHPATEYMEDNIPIAEVYVESSPRTMQEMERQNIIDSLKRNNGNRGKAARELGISERTLYRKIRIYEID
ncbi:MAG: sigma-54 dependent transcriptional regulator [Bacteroidaceae bacterium]|nr:sigma-54 dependent transcriptional regulator [Bacteroidaceae bacterium]